MTTYSADDLLTDSTDDPGTFTPTNDSVFDQPTPEPPKAETSAEPMEGEVIQRDEIAKPEDTWPHELLEFKGDTLQVRAPSDQALTAFSLASGRFVPMEIKNDIVGLFVSKHLSLQSYGHVFARLMDPDDEGYNPETIGELMRAIVGISLKKREAEEAATKAAAEKNGSA